MAEDAGEAEDATGVAGVALFLLSPLLLLAPLLLPSGEAEREAEREAEGEAEGEAGGEAGGEAEGEAGGANDAPSTNFFKALRYPNLIGCSLS